MDEQNKKTVECGRQIKTDRELTKDQMKKQVGKEPEETKVTVEDANFQRKQTGAELGQAQLQLS